MNCSTSRCTCGYCNRCISYQTQYQTSCNRHNHSHSQPCCKRGPMGPTGPAGSGAIASFDLAITPPYLSGQLIDSNGQLYVVNTDNPTGTPGSSTDFTYLSSVGALESSITPGTTLANVVDPQGNSVPLPYGDNLIFATNTPQNVSINATTGSAIVTIDVTGVSGSTGSGITGPTGPMGPQGAAVATAFNTTASTGYTLGQLITYAGNLYTVNNAPPSGTPGTSPDYTLVGSGATGSSATGTSITGPTGVGITGPTGPGITGPTGIGTPGPTGPMGPTGIGTTGPTGTFDTSTPLFTVSGPTGVAAPVYVGDSLIYTTNTPNILTLSSATGSAIVNIDHTMAWGTFATLSQATIATGTTTAPVTLPLDIDVAGSGDMSLTNNTVTINKAGLYSVSVMTQTNSPTSLAILVNGAVDNSNLTAFGTGSSSGGASTLTTVIPLTAGDTLSIGNISSGTTLSSAVSGSDVPSATLTISQLQ